MKLETTLLFKSVKFNVGFLQQLVWILNFCVFVWVFFLTQHLKVSRFLIFSHLQCQPIKAKFAHIKKSIDFEKFLDFNDFPVEKPFLLVCGKIEQDFKGLKKEYSKSENSKIKNFKNSRLYVG